MAVARGITYWLVAFVLSFALWLIHDDTLKLPELLAGAAVAALAATATELVRRQRIAQMTMHPRQLRSAWRLIPTSIRDCGALTRAACSQLVNPQAVRGVTVAQPFAHGGGDADENGRRALAQGFGSFAPATIVAGVDPERDVVIAHQLAAAGKPSDLDPLGLA
jgi:hypothetical protein